MRMRALTTLACISLLMLILSGCATVGGKVTRRPAPEFTVELVGGGTASLSEFRGRPLVLGMGATWCPHCMHEAPIFRRVYDRYKDRVGMMGILVKSPAKDAEALVRKNSLDFKIGLDPDERVKKSFGATGIPTTYFIDKDGYIVDENFGGMEEDELAEKIERLTAGQPPM